MAFPGKYPPSISLDNPWEGIGVYGFNYTFLIFFQTSQTEENPQYLNFYKYFPKVFSWIALQEITDETAFNFVPV